MLPSLSATTINSQVIWDADAAQHMTRLNSWSRYFGSEALCWGGVHPLGILSAVLNSTSQEAFEQKLFPAHQPWDFAVYNLGVIAFAT